MLGLKITTFLSLITASIFVFGFLPILDFFLLMRKLPNEDNFISFPFESEFAFFLGYFERYLKSLFLIDQSAYILLHIFLILLMFC